MNVHDEIRNFMKDHFTTYSFPENNMQADTLCVFETAELSSGCQFASTERHLLLPYAECGKLSEILFELKRNDLQTASLPLTIYIYCESEIEPLFVTTAEWVEDTVRFEIKEKFAPGKYFILIPNTYCNNPRGEFDEKGGHLCFPFQVLNANMKESNLPIMQECSPIWKSITSDDHLSWYSGSITMKLLLNGNWNYGKDQYAMLLLSKNGRLLSADLDGVIRKESEKSMNAKFVLQTDYVLFPENHDLYLYKNGVPFLYIELQLSEYNTHVERTEPIEQGSELYKKAFDSLYGKVNQRGVELFSDESPSAIVHYLQESLFNRGYWMTDGAEYELSKLVRRNYKSSTPYDWSEENAARYIEEYILTPHNKRLIEEMDSEWPKRELKRISRIDLMPFPESLCQDKNLENCMEELNELVGLQNVKNTFLQTMRMIQFQKKREALGLRSSANGNHHMLFLGNPGTGKTTVAKLIAKMFKEMGIISTNMTMVMDRKSLIKSYIGHTDEHMQEVINNARGKVLFIDEAYTLIDSEQDRKDFGYRVIESLLTVMAEPNCDMVVIMAGYEKEMQRLLNTNPGLRGRFAHVFNFEDYNCEELMQMADQLLQKEDYVLSLSARKRLIAHIDETLANKDEHFSNGRWINQYVLKGILVAMAERVMLSPENEEVDFYRTIEEEDVIKGYKEYRPALPKGTSLRRPIGFVA